MAYEEMSLQGFVREFKLVSQVASEASNPRKFCFVLGAGASITSGIPTGQQLIDQWDNELIEKNRKNYDKWKDSLQITPENKYRHYGDYYKKRFERDQCIKYHDGTNFLEAIMSNVTPSIGYDILANIMSHTPHNVIITTNFDHLAEHALTKYTQTYLSVGHEDLAKHVPKSPTHPTIIKIHRDFLFSPKNKPEELEKLDPRWIPVLDNIFSEYSPIFIGYAGNDSSLMNFLLENCEKFLTGKWYFPYWLVYGDDLPEQNVIDFLNSSNSSLINHNGFDDVMKKLGAVLHPDPPCTANKITGITSSEKQEFQNHHAKSRALYISNRYTEALEECGQALSFDPNNADIHILKGNILVHLGRYGESLTAYNKAMQFAPDLALIPANMGLAFRLMNQYEESIKKYNQALKLAPKDAGLHYNMGVTLYLAKKYEDALLSFQSSIQLSADNPNPDIYLYLSFALDALNRKDEAAEARAKAEELRKKKTDT